MANWSNQLWHAPAATVTPAAKARESAMFFRVEGSRSIERESGRSTNRCSAWRNGYTFRRMRRAAVGPASERARGVSGAGHLF